MNHTTHPVEREELMAWLDGELSAARAEDVAAHVETCDDCRRLVEDFRRVSAQLAAWRVEAAPGRLDAGVNEALLEGSERKEVLSISTPKRRFLLPIWAWQLAGAALLLLLIFSAISGRYAQLSPRDMGGLKPPSNSAYVTLPPPQPTQSTTAKDQQGSLAFSTSPSPRLGQRGGSGSARENEGEDLRVPARPMIIRTATLVIVSKEFDTARADFERLLRQHGGYVAELSISGQGGNARILAATLRVPAARMDALFTELKKIGRVQSEGQSGEEVTQQYVDLVARLKNARVTEQRLAQILTQRTGKVSEVLEVEQEIARVREEIERMEAQRKTMENQVAFASVKFELREEYKAQLEVAPPSTASRLRNAAVEGYKSAVENAIGVTEFLLGAGPSLLLWGLIFFWPARLLWRHFRRATAA